MRSLGLKEAVKAIDHVVENAESSRRLPAFRTL